MRYKVFTFGILVTLVLFIIFYASRKSDIFHNYTSIPSKTSIQLQTKKINVGTITRDSVWQGELNIKNIGKNNLIIYKIQTSCGCLTATAPRKPVPPDSVCTIKIKVAPKNEGSFVQRIGIACNTEISPTILSIKGKCKL